MGSCVLVFAGAFPFPLLLFASSSSAPSSSESEEEGWEEVELIGGNSGGVEGKGRMRAPSVEVRWESESEAEEGERRGREDRACVLARRREVQRQW